MGAAGLEELPPKPLCSPSGHLLLGPSLATEEEVCSLSSHTRENPWTAPGWSRLAVATPLRDRAEHANLSATTLLLGEKGEGLSRVRSFS